MTEHDGSSIAQGTLAERPFARLLFFLRIKKVTGFIVIRDESGDKSVIYLRDGLPVHVDRPDELDRLDRVFVDTGVVSSKKIGELERVRAERGRRLGEVAVELGMLDEKKLGETLKLQLRRKLTRLFFQQKASFEVFANDHSFALGKDFDLMRIEPRVVIYSGIRAAYDDGRLTRELMPLAGRLSRLGAGATPEVLGEMGFLPPDERVLGELGGAGLGLLGLVKLGSRAADAKAVLLALLYSDLIESRSAEGAEPAAKPVPPPAPRVTTGMAAVAAPPASAAPVLSRVTTGMAAAAAPPASAAPALPARVTTAMATVVAPPAAAAPSTLRPTATHVAVSPAVRITTSSMAAVPDADLRTTITDLGKRLDKLTHFEILGLPESAASADVNAAYLRAVKQFHPDRMAGLGLGDLRANVERIMARASEANGVLGDATKRAEYVRWLKVGDAGRAEAMAAVDAEMHFQKGEVFLRKGDFPRAEQEFAAAVKGNPDEPEHRALLAWARFAGPAANKDALAAETARVIQEATKARPRFARGHHFLGEVWKHTKEMDKAEQAFQAAVRLDRNFLDPQRELRLIGMRRQQKSKK